MVLARGVTERNAGILLIFVFDSGWHWVFLITQLMFLDCDLGGCDKEEADVLVNFSGHLDEIWLTL